MSVANFRCALVIVLLSISAHARAICPIGNEHGTQHWTPAASDSNQNHKPTAYRPAGETSDGTIVLHAVGGLGSTSESHDLLLVRPATEPGPYDDPDLHPVTLGGEDYVIERTERVTVDQPCQATVAVEGDDVVITIVAP
jgi:hypothetical protein